MCSSAATAALDTIPGFAPGLEGAPARTFVSAGQPAFDCCPFLSVDAAACGRQTRPDRTGCGHPAPVGIQAQPCRGAACGSPGALRRSGRAPPPTAALSAVAEQTNADAWALWNYMWNIDRAGSPTRSLACATNGSWTRSPRCSPAAGVPVGCCQCGLNSPGYGDGENP